MAKITCYEYVYNFSYFFESNVVFVFYRIIMVFISTFYFDWRKRVSSLREIIELFLRRISKQGANKLTSIQNPILNPLRRVFCFFCFLFYFQRGCQINKVLQTFFILIFISEMHARKYDFFSFRHVIVDIYSNRCI